MFWAKLDTDMPNWISPCRGFSQCLCTDRRHVHFVGESDLNTPKMAELYFHSQIRRQILNWDNVLYEFCIIIIIIVHVAYSINKLTSVQYGKQVFNVHLKAEYYSTSSIV